MVDTASKSLTTAAADGSSRPSVIQLVFREKGALYAAYIPLFSEGGLFVPTSRDYRLGEDIYLLLSLPARAALDGQAPLRFPVQGLIRPTGRAAQARWHDFRGLAGRIESGRVAVGDTLAVAEPSQGELRSARVSAILLHEQERQQAQAGDSITLVLDADLDISRGAVLVHADQPATLSDRLEVDLCWMDERPGRPGQRLLVKQGTRTLAARIEALLGVVDVNTGQTEAVSDPASALRRNAVVRARLHTERPLLADPYRRLPRTGSLILLEPGEFATLAAGVIRG